MLNKFKNIIFKKNFQRLLLRVLLTCRTCLRLLNESYITAGNLIKTKIYIYNVL